MKQLNVLIKYIGCAGITFIGIILLPLGTLTCIENDNDFLGKTLMYFWIVVWICATAFVYKAIFG